MDKVAIVFPGQGSQYIGMGKKLYESFDIAKEVFQEAKEVLNFDIGQMCFNGNIEDLTKTENTQPAILTTSVAAFKVYMNEIGIKPDYCAGHSLGELSALTCAGAIKFSDALKISKERGRFMQEVTLNSLGAMAAISGLDKNIVSEECEKVSTDKMCVFISNYNSNNQIVISGHKIVVDKVCEVLGKYGGKYKYLNVKLPFHSPLMKPAALRLEAELKRYRYEPLKFPVISNVTALPYKDEMDIVTNLTNQVVSAVRWREIVSYMNCEKVDFTFEMAPNMVLSKLIKQDFSNIGTCPLQNDKDINQIKNMLRIDKEAKLEFITKCLCESVSTKNYHEYDEEYKTKVIYPIRRVRNLLEELEKDGEEPKVDVVKMALEMLKSVFSTKRVSSEEQVSIINSLFIDTNLERLMVESL